MITETIQKRQWQRVSRREPCRICGKSDWCTVSDDGAACCMRVESEKPLRNGGYLHKLDAPTNQPYRPAMRREPPTPPIDAAAMLERWKQATEPALVVGFADEFGVDPLSLLVLGAVWANEHHALAFPMHDGAGRVVGIRLRTPEGDKFAVKGSKAGLFFAPAVKPQPIVFILEGPTDTAAALTLGLFAIGRPSCLGCHSEVIQTIRRLGCRKAVIVSDSDEPGHRGAEKLQEALPVPSVIFTPPAKDLRAAADLRLPESDRLTRAEILRETNDCVWTFPQERKN